MVRALADQSGGDSASFDTQEDAPGAALVRAQGDQYFVPAASGAEGDHARIGAGGVGPVRIVEDLPAIDPHLNRPIVAQRRGQLHRLVALEVKCVVDDHVPGSDGGQFQVPVTEALGKGTRLQLQRPTVLRIRQALKLPGKLIIFPIGLN